jgi:hypothetical protein
MVLEPNEHALYIFGGMEQNDRHLSDMHVFDLDTNTSVELFPNFAASGGPDKISAQRAVIDPTLKEIYVYVPSRHLFSLPRADHGVSQVLWFEAHPNPSTTAQPRALGLPLLFPARYLDTYAACTYSARQRTTCALRASGHL